MPTVTQKKAKENRMMWHERLFGWYDGSMRVRQGEIFALVLFVAFSAFGWWFIGEAATIFSLSLFGIGSISLVLAAAIFILTVGLDQYGFSTAMLAAANALCALLLALPWFSGLAFAAAFVSFLLGIAAVWRMRGARKDLLHFRWGYAVGKVLPLWIWAVGTIIAMALFLNSEGRDELLRTVPTKMVAVVFPPMARALHPATNINFDTSVDRLFEQLLRTKNSTQVKAQRENLSRQLGLPVDGDMQVREVLAALLERQFRTFLSLFGHWVAIGFVVIFMLVFQIVALPFGVLLKMVLPVLFRIFLLVRLAEEREETIVRKIPQWV